jgi:hypothetical protein
VEGCSEKRGDKAAVREESRQSVSTLGTHEQGRYRSLLWHHLSNGGKFATLREAVRNKESASLACLVIARMQLLLNYKRRIARTLPGTLKGIAQLC